MLDSHFHGNDKQRQTPAFYETITLVKHLFSDLPYVSLEDPDTREFAAHDPRE